MKYVGNLSAGLVSELLEVVYRYEETLVVATVVGCLELVKLQVLEDQKKDDEDD